MSRSTPSSCARRRRRVSGLLLVPILAAAACSGTDDDAATTDAATGVETATTDTATDAAADTGQSGGAATDTREPAAAIGDAPTDGAAAETEATIVGDEVIDIQDAILTDRSADCADYVNTYIAAPTDIQNELVFDAQVEITATDSHCTFLSNSVPNHDFNDETAAFAGGEEGATITAIESISIVTRTPELANEVTWLSQNVKNAVFLNGVRLDQATAGCYDPDSPMAGDDGNTGIGCQSTDPWILDAIGSEGSFGVDEHNGHTQPGGLYHYHGSPNALFDDEPGPEGSPVIGFAADGFPIYGSYFLDSETGEVRAAVSGYTLKEGSRGERSDTNPGGDYDGTYVDDYEFTGVGDLDECNGMTVDGQYGYYVTDAFPWVMNCLSGTPDDSFIQGGDGGGEAPADGSRPPGGG
ncbi:MAG: YHYH protein [Actinomycetota bacterium]